MFKQSMAVTLVAAISLIPTVRAASETTLTFYGRAHISVDSLDDGNQADVGLNSNNSRVGVRVSHDLRPGLHVIAQIEREVEWNDGSVELTSRDSFLGLQGEFGTLRLGFIDTPLRVLRNETDLFGDQLGDARNLTRVRDGYSGGDYDFDTRFRNSIHYRAPDLAGWNWELHYSTNTDSGQNLNTDNSAISSAVTYSEGAWYAALAYERK